MEKDSVTEKTSWLLEILKQLLAYSSALAALSYLFGRSFFNGYFRTIGINVSFIKLSLFDYLEAGWLYLWATGILLVIFISYSLLALTVYYLIVPLFEEFSRKYKKIFISLMIIAWLSLVIYLIKDAALKFLQNLSLVSWVVFCFLILLIFVFRKMILRGFSAWGRLLRSKPDYIEKMDRLIETNSKMFLQLVLLLTLLATFYYSAMKADEAGSKKALDYLGKEASLVEIIGSDSALLSETSKTDLRFLYFNDGRYFFSTFDNFCKPKEVLIISEKDVLRVKMIAPLPEMTCLAK
jgi:hypothetical protein